jgi:hypothetical protein
VEIQRARRDILAGTIFIAFGLAFAAISLTYEVGTPVRMGPGYFPLVLGGVLALLGISIIAKGFLAGEGQPIGQVAWRPMIVIVAGVLFFGATVRGLGLVPSLFVATLLSTFASPRIGLVAAVLIAAGLTALSVLIFVVALQLRLALLGPWIGF